MYIDETYHPALYGIQFSQDIYLLGGLKQWNSDHTRIWLHSARLGEKPVNSYESYKYEHSGEFQIKIS